MERVSERTGLAYEHVAAFTPHVALGSDVGVRVDHSDLLGRAAPTEGRLARTGREVDGVFGAAGRTYDSTRHPGSVRAPDLSQNHGRALVWARRMPGSRTRTRAFASRCFVSGHPQRLRAGSRRPSPNFADTARKTYSSNVARTQTFR